MKSFLYLVPGIVLAIALVAVPVWAGGGAEESAVEQGGLITYSYLIPELAEAAVQQAWPVAQELQKRTNVALEFVPVAVDQVTEKLNILIAANEVPDMTLLLPETARRFGSEEAFLDLTPYITAEMTPNIMKIYQEFPGAKTVGTSGVDGGIYALPGMNFEPGQFYKNWMARRDLMVKHGIKPPKTPEEFYNFLSAFKKLYPESYPMSGTQTEINMYPGFINVFIGIDSGYAGGYGFGWDPREKKFEFAPAEPGFREMLVFMNRLFRDGLLDPEFAVITSKNPLQERMLSGKSFVTYDSRLRTEQWTAAAQKADPKTGFDMFAIEPWAAPTGARMVPARPSVEAGENGIALSPKIRQPERAMKLIDYLYSPEGRILMNYGVEGLSYEMQGGTIVAKAPFNNPQTMARELRKIGAAYQGFRLTTLPEMTGYPPRIVERDELLTPFLTTEAPILRDDEQQSEIERQKLANIQKYFEQELAKFIMGRTPITDQTLAAFRRECNRLGAQEIVDGRNRVMKASR